jgi:ABC-type transport system substrate-binding protein
VALTLNPAWRHETGRTGGRLRRALVASAVVVAMIAGCGAQPGVDGSSEPARILIGGASTLDPAAAGDAGSAGIIAQVYETLTAFDASLTLQPALAESWEIEDGGRRIVFRLRDGLKFSDGTPLEGHDVVRSWLRLIDPDNPSPLVSLILDVEGALDYLRGETDDPSGVGLSADGLEVTVNLTRPAADFVTVVAGSSFGVVPPGFGDDPALEQPGSFVASGGYTIEAADGGTTTLAANPRYWAGEPAIDEVVLVHDLGGRSPVQVYEEGEIDYAPIGDFDASWIAYDATLGPQLREVPSLSVQYYGFDTTRPPFDDVRVRQAFGAAVDWRRIVELGSTGSETVANSMVPPGIPNSTERDFLPEHDPDAGRRLLADAGFPDGQGFPEVTMLTGGGQYDEAIVTEIERELEVEITYETMSFDTYFDRLDAEPPHIWSLSWVADYPGPNDFLGVLLGSESSNNYGGWMSAEFDAAITAAGAAEDEATARDAYDEAESIIQRDVPVVPVSYGTGWALSRPALLGAEQNGLGSIRMAGLAWAE